MLLKPRFGIRMWSGIWPPSKPAIDTPERAFAPFWPRPAVLPSPEPMPRPTRTRPWRAPLLSRSSLSFIVCTRFRFCRAVPSPDTPEKQNCLALDAQEVLHFAHLPEHFGCGFDLHG